MASEVPTLSPKPSGLEKVVSTGHSLRMPYGIHAQESLQKLLLPGQTVKTAHAGEYGTVDSVPQGEVVAMNLSQLSEISLSKYARLPIVEKDGRHYLQIPPTETHRAMREVELTPGKLLFIGRSVPSTRADKAITIPIPSVSGEHVAVYVSPSDQTIFIEDLHSTNGTTFKLSNRPTPSEDTDTIYSG